MGGGGLLGLDLDAQAEEEIKFLNIELDQVRISTYPEHIAGFRPMNSYRLALMFCLLSPKGHPKSRLGLA
jgi:hypothetical protein